MASAHRGREFASGLDEEFDTQQIAKRHANFPWTPACAAILRGDAAGAPRTMDPHAMWRGAGVPAGIVPRMPSPHGSMPISGFPPMMMRVPSTEEARQMEAFQAAVGNAMMTVGGCAPFAQPFMAAGMDEVESTAGDTARSDVLGNYPADTAALRTHVAYEATLFAELRERVNEHGHFSNMVSLLERYFKGALTPQARTKAAKIVQRAIDDRDTTVDETRRLKHLLDALKHPAAQTHTPSGADAAYFHQLSAAHQAFVTQYGKSRKVK